MRRARPTYWRDAALAIRFVGIDARAYFPLLIWMYHPRKWLFIVACLIIGGFYLLEKKGYTIEVFFRKIKHWLRGTVVYGRAWWHHRKY